MFKANDILTKLSVFNIVISFLVQRYHVSLQYQLVILESRQTDNNKLFKAMAVNSYTGQSSDSQTFVLKVQGRNDHLTTKKLLDGKQSID